MRVMGVDPGLARLGYGVVEGAGGRLVSLAGGCLTTRASDPAHERLSQLYDGLSEVLGEFRPEAVAVERLFFNLNAKTAVPVLRASGVVLLAAGRSGAAVFEYTPLEVKESVTGTGTATKDQIRFMVSRLLSLDGLPKGADHADALALAICHLHSRRLRVVLGGAG